MINCVLISEPQNELLNILLSNISIGLSMGQWAWHISELPRLILQNNPHYKYKYMLNLLDPVSFCSVHWTHGYLLNDPDFKPPENAYGIHLFETILGPMLEDSIFVNKY